MKRILSVALLFLVCQTAFSQQPASKPGWDSLKFLLGKWVGEGTSEVGEGSGYFTFETSLNDKVLVRKNRAEYPATKDRPKVVHEDVMIVYFDPATKQPRAFYTDSEGNVINYVVSSDGKTVVFLSDPQTAGPRYRLTYVVTEPDRMSLTFEVASPDKPDQFRKFIDGKVRKVANSK
jgi:hypothetical protein